jgi:predicted nuclease of predicted toxin-antitoxin system
MKFLIDAHLPRHLSFLLQYHGYDAVHTLDLENGNRTSDTQINDLSEHEQRIVITKDADFVDSFLITKRPYKLLLVSTGNITNKELSALFVKNLLLITTAFNKYDYVELTRSTLIEHR